jgi:hypothetical protein
MVRAMREHRLIRGAIEKLQLDLSGRVVYTEAASNAYLWTPLIAALAGAEKVFAITQDSGYATAEMVTKATLSHAHTLGVADKVIIVREKTPEDVSQADIITNLGFVRPIDAAMIGCMKSRAVISLMWEPWEFREEDLDLAACRQRGITVLGTNEGHPQLGTFKFVALTALKLLLQNQFEIRGCRILLLGSGPFVEETRTCLASEGAEVLTASAPVSADIPPLDAVVCLEHHDREALLLGNTGWVHEGIDRDKIGAVIHICGKIDHGFVVRQGWRCIPVEPAPPGRMSFTTAYVGPKPVIDLHAAGLKVGQAHLDGDDAVLRDLALPLPELLGDKS